MLHQLGILAADLHLPKVTALAAGQLDVEVEEVDDHALHGVDHRVAVEVVGVDGQAAAQVVEVEGADLLLLVAEVHHGVLEEGQVSAGAVVGRRRGDLHKIAPHIYDLHGEVGAGALHAERHLLLRHNHAVALGQGEGLLVHAEPAAAAAAEGVGDVAAVLHLRHVGQVVRYDDFAVHNSAAKLRIFSETTTEVRYYILSIQ